MSRSTKVKTPKAPVYIELDIKTLTFGGQALGHFEDTPAFVWNALPGERVRARVTRKKSKIIEAVAEEILTPSPDRRVPTVAHYLASSPWQILSEEQEQQWKLDLAKQTYERLGKLVIPECDILPVTQWFGYRNKIEFSFFEHTNDDVRTERQGQGMSLAFFERSSHYKQPITESELAEPIINEVAQHILKWINQQGCTRFDVKSLIVRSNGKVGAEARAIAAVFLKSDREYTNWPERIPGLDGIHVYYSYYKSPASVPTRLLHSDGDDALMVQLGDTKFQFGWESFFQVNLPIFEQVLADIKQHIPLDVPVVDMYSGVGAIGLSVTREQQLTMVEINDAAVEFAKRNIELNNRKNATAVLAASENALEYIQADHTIIVDPPRAGLHEDVRRRLIEVLPPRIVYMSCNVGTQARDLRDLDPYYDISFLRVYNMFPRTPHIEALAILIKKVTQPV